MTIGDNQTISASDLNTEHNANRTTIDLIRQTKVGLRVRVSKANLTSSDAEVTRQVIFTPQDNYELVAMWVQWNDLANTTTLTATLSVASGETEYILDDTVQISTTAGTSNGEATANYATTSATRYVLRKGVAYALTISAAASVANDLVEGVAVFKVKRRYS